MKKITPKYYVNEANEFVIENYNNARAFSNFLPGIAGFLGVPMWAFYVNRGQCVTSFGIESKDKSILEFQPANKAYRLTPTQGFRTLLKIKTGRSYHFYEPFQSNLVSQRFKMRQRMVISSDALRLEEDNISLGLAVQVRYFTLPEEPRSALIRRINVLDTSGRARDIEMVDGLPLVTPYGMTDELLKNISRTAEAWASVSNLARRAPYYRLKVRMSDNPLVEPIVDGNFYFAFESHRTNGKLLAPIIDSACVFGASQDFSYPEKFLQDTKFSLPKAQFASNRSPAAMCFSRFRLPAHGQREFVSLAGYARSEADLNRFVATATRGGYIEGKREQNAQIIAGIKSYAVTNCSSAAFNEYCGQTFLDNVLRGGLPVSLKTSEGDSMAFNVFSRKHGDPERDYNRFYISPTFYSQGTGNYRDVNQNRRSDIWFNPDVKDSSLISLFNLIQADGYNPLSVCETSFLPVDLAAVDRLLGKCVEEAGAETVRQVIQGGFQPGALITALTSVKLSMKPHELLARVLSLCEVDQTAKHGEGFWTDHWTYNLDLLETYLRFYPENLSELLLTKKTFSFYHNTHYVLPRDQRYVLSPQGVRQYNSVRDGSKEIQRKFADDKLRTQNGAGPVYYTTLIAKLICVVANKAASFDPSGMGLEMEADKPNWYDALNGLPGLTGSSISETFELKRCCSVLSMAFDTTKVEARTTIVLFEELADFVHGLVKLLQTLGDELNYWNASNDLKETYRERVRAGVSGNERNVSVQDIREWLELIERKVEAGLARATTSSSYVTTYFTHDANRYERLDGASSDTLTRVRPTHFQRHDLPLYLEGFVHALRVEKSPVKAKEIYAQVRRSALFDRKLKMYKVNASLKSESEEIGRCRIFPPGWLENESIWLHMEYKYLLEVLRAGLVEEFYEDFRNVLVPFMDPQHYGRSIFENSSFIVSSAHEDKQLHGQGFVARLSGSTAEFLHIWLLMNMGAQPFTLNSGGELAFELKPSLADWLFTEKESVMEYRDHQKTKHSAGLRANTYAFMFLGSTLIVYYNPARKNTFGDNACSVCEYRVTLAASQQEILVNAAAIVGPLAEDIRARKASRIDIVLG